jgi:hypothetical protein
MHYAFIKTVCAFSVYTDWEGNTPQALATNWIKGGKIILTVTIKRIYPDPNTGKFDMLGTKGEIQCRLAMQQEACTSAARVSMWHMSQTPCVPPLHKSGKSHVGQPSFEHIISRVSMWHIPTEPDSPHPLGCLLQAASWLDHTPVFVVTQATRSTLNWHQWPR